ncbi:hypothetical protein CERZMDRAFT_46201, partial [Cercospora zeae-maydis SCOH1-5]
TVQVNQPVTFSTTTTYDPAIVTPVTTTIYTGTVLVVLPATDATQAPITVVATSRGTPQREPFTIPAPPTVPVDQPIAAPTACNNQGLAWADYRNTGGDWTPGYPSFVADTYKLAQPRHQGITDSIGGFSFAQQGTTGTLQIYNGVSIPSNFWVINHQAYIYPGVSGDYTFTSYNADDLVLVWFGPTAYAGWTRSNAILEQVYAFPPQGFSGFPGEPPVSATITLEAGVYYPIRVLAANAQNQAEFHLLITAPDGTEFLGPQTTASPYLVQYSCDGTSAPAFPAFGSQV